MSGALKVSVAQDTNQSAASSIQAKAVVCATIFFGFSAVLPIIRWRMERCFPSSRTSMNIFWRLIW